MTIETAFFGTLGPDQNGKPRFGLSVMSWHCRIAAIGKNNPTKKTTKGIRGDVIPGANTFYDAQIPFCPEWL